ncbi:hypothetical protein FKW77_000345 [Venturia effusa]|uniref:Nodulin-like domain-containing protein n=1 Tax=Venturia effusa TaxID=50376 RepID=A0A517L4R3_9PEZI|nr:hypothetical protein FKW77_000345 [Venturia effusa]
MDESKHRRARYIAVGASTAISLACGTNYAYSAWAPQFAERMQLSATQSNLIGTMGNMGMYASGIPLGYVVDSKGPHPGVLLGSIALGAGYFLIKRAYDGGPGSISIGLLCFSSFLTGLGSCAAFQASIKTCALNWPLHRGTATAFPVAAFGLSAFFFTALSGLAFGDDTSDYLLLLAAGTFVLTFFSLFFITIPHAEAYHALTTSEDHHSAGRPRRDSNPLHQVWQTKPLHPHSREEPTSAIEEVEPPSALESRMDSEVSSLLSSSSSSSGPGDIISEDETDKPRGSSHRHHSRRIDISAFQLLKRSEFYVLWIMLGILTGIGLMTINNIGNDAQALWYAYDPKVDQAFITNRQLMHVSIISCMSFVGRFVSGIGSDFLVKQMKMSRFWCLVCSSLIFILAQVAGLNISNPNFLWAVSGLSGLGYGALFGVYPALVVDAFGVSGLSVNWGFMTLAPVLWGNIFNLAYGSIFDKHSTTVPGGSLLCKDGLECYKDAYRITFVASVVGIFVCLYSVWHEKRAKAKEEEFLNDHTA